MGDGAGHVDSLGMMVHRNWENARQPGRSLWFGLARMQPLQLFRLWRLPGGHDAGHILRDGIWYRGKGVLPRHVPFYRFGTALCIMESRHKGSGMATIPYTIPNVALD